MTVSVDDVAALLGRDLTATEEDRVSRLVEIAESLVEAELPGYSLATGTETVEVVWHDPDVIWTPRYPVTALHRVLIGDGLVDPSWLRWGDKGRIELLGGRPPWVVNGSWLTGVWPKVTVDYDYGRDPPAPGLAGVVAQMVATLLRRQGSNPGNVHRETIGDYSVQFDPIEVEATARGMVVPPLHPRWSRTITVSVPLSRSR